MMIEKRLNSQQRYALSALYRWRDERSRAEDESIDYVLPNHMLLKIAEVLLILVFLCKLPKIQGIF